MAVIYNKTNVDEEYSSKLEANLYYNEVLVPGVTCSDEYEIHAGGYYVRKLASGTVSPKAPGSDFVDSDDGDSLIQIVMNNSFQKSRKIYNVAAENCEADLKDANLSEAEAECREGWTLSGLACLCKEGKSGTIPSTATTAKKKLIAARKAIKKRKGHADVVMASPDFYAEILEEAGAEFTPNRNERIADTGSVGNWLGFTIIEATGMVESAAQYIDTAGTTQTVDMSGISFAMYDHDTLSVITNIDMARLVDSEMFNGCKAQVEMNTGYKVRNTDLTFVA